MNTDRLEVLEKRLSALERQNRWLKRACMLVACVVGVGVLTGARIFDDALEIKERLLVRDANGAARCVLGDEQVRGLANGLILYDADGKQRITLTVDDKGEAGLLFNDLNGKPIARYP